MVNKISISLVILLITFSMCLQAQSMVSDPVRFFTLSGLIVSQSTGETLIAASIKAQGTTQTTLSNAYGFYSLTLPEGNYTIEISAVGFKKITQQLLMDKDTVLQFKMLDQINTLKLVQVNGSTGGLNLENPQMGVERFNVRETNHIPVLLGEKDIIKTMLLLPGVKTAGEGNAGFFVRGGGADQNTVLLDGSPIYNASHLLGFFSTFNADAIKNVTLYKSGMPAQYGGGLSSVLDVKMNDGNNQNFSVNGGVSLIAARLSLEGPIQKDKSSFLISGRRTYVDQLLQLSTDPQVKNTSLYFYDLNLKASYILNEKNRIYVSGYLGKDVFESEKLNGLEWGNSVGTLRWNQLLNNKLFSNSSFIYSKYNYTVDVNGGKNAMSIFSQIHDYSFKQDMQWYPNERNILHFGLNSIYHTIKPGEVLVTGNTDDHSQKLDDLFSLENAAYISHSWKVNRLLNLTYGLRLAVFSVLKKLNITYVNPEPRISTAVQLNKSDALKLSYARNTQNLHLISSSTALSPTDRWIASTNVIKPETSDQFSVGYYRSFNNKRYEFTMETYYKKLNNQIDYKNGSDVFTNAPIETMLLFGIGRAYGLEFLFKKNTGVLTGWLGYTLSKTERKIDGINNGNWYLARQDRTHDFSAVLIYKISPLWTTSMNWVYSTGNAVTFPNGKYNISRQNYFYYADRNADRMPNYHRLDFGASYLLRKTRKFSSELSISLYNAYGRRNAYQIQFQESTTHPGQTEAVQTTLFRFVPSIAYNFKF
jgi:hypothetical protein